MNKETTVKEYCRPKTRGELRDKLKDGITCEVAEYVAESTAILLDGWLNFDDFSINNSDNQGWVLFVPRKSIKETQ